MCPVLTGSPTLPLPAPKALTKTRRRQPVACAVAKNSGFTRWKISTGRWPLIVWSAPITTPIAGGETVVSTSFSLIAKVRTASSLCSGTGSSSTESNGVHPKAKRPNRVPGALLIFQSVRPHQVRLHRSAGRKGQSFGSTHAQPSVGQLPAVRHFSSRP